MKQKTIKDMIKPLKSMPDDNTKGEIFKTGFAAIDDHIPLRTGTLNIIAGVRGMGKTDLALNFVNNVTLNGDVPSVMFSNLYSYEVIEKLIHIRYKKDISELGKGLIEKVESIESSKFGVINIQKYDFDKLLEKIYFLCGKGDKLFIIDDLKMLGEPHRTYGYEKQLKLLSGLARKMGIVILLLISLPNGDDERPCITYLSRVLNMDYVPCNVWFLYRKSYYYCTEDKTAEIIVSNGINGDDFPNKLYFDECKWAVTLDYDLDNMRYTDITDDELSF
jgi:Replicative DNA helicase